VLKLIVTLMAFSVKTDSFHRIFLTETPFDRKPWGFFFSSKSAKTSPTNLLPAIILILAVVQCEITYFPTYLALDSCFNHKLWFDNSTKIFDLILKMGIMVMGIFV
jgi:hypothetical protein